MRCCALLGALMMAGTAAAADSDFTDAAMRQLRDATRPQRSGSHLPNLAALRNLKDPALRPFFYQLAQHPEWAVQVHAVLGLAELGSDDSIDPWLVQQVSSQARGTLVAEALDTDLIGTEQMLQLLAWPLLEPRPKLMLVADLVTSGIEVEQAILKELAVASELDVALFASLMLGGEQVLEEATTRLSHSSGRERHLAMTNTLRLIRIYRPPAAAAWLDGLLDANPLSLTSDDRYWTLLALLNMDAELGMAAWRREVPSVPSRQTQVRYALLLMEAGLPTDAVARARLAIDSGDTLLDAMMRAGEAAALETPDCPRLVVALVETGHAASAEWAFRLLKRMDKALAIELLSMLAVLPDPGEGGIVHPRRQQVAIRAAEMLYEQDAKAALALLAAADDDSPQQEVLLLALLQAGSDDASLAAAGLRRIGVGHADAMTLLLAARGTTSLPTADRRALGIIAAGGGRVQQPLQTQAAWLYLKRMGLTERALAAVTNQ